MVAGGNEAEKEIITPLLPWGLQRTGVPINERREDLPLTKFLIIVAVSLNDNGQFCITAVPIHNEDVIFYGFIGSPEKNHPSWLRA